jgi:hypothetical protein
MKRARHVGQVACGVPKEFCLDGLESDLEPDAFLDFEIDATMDAASAWIVAKSSFMAPVSS